MKLQGVLKSYVRQKLVSPPPQTERTLKVCAVLTVRPVRDMEVVYTVLMLSESSWYCHSVALPVSLQARSAVVGDKLDRVMLSGRGQGNAASEILSTAGGGVLPPEPSQRKTNARWYTPAVGTATTPL